jgi:transposase
MVSNERRLNMRTIGIDLAVTATHKAVVVDDTGQFVTPVLSFRSRWEEIAHLVARAREGVEADHPLQAVMEPTGMAWFNIAVPLSRLGITVYLVNGRKVAALRRYYKQHAGSDRISARVLAKLPLVDAESLYPLAIPTPVQLACQRGCKQDDRLQTWITAIQNRLLDTDRFAWPGLEQVLPDPFGPTARFFRQDWYDPARVIEAGSQRLSLVFAAVVGPKDDLSWVKGLVELAIDVLKLYGLEALDYARLQEEIRRDQELLAKLEQQQAELQKDTVQPLYRQLHPSGHLQTLYGVGKKGAPVFASFIGQADRFVDNRHFRGWHGLVPDSRQSGESESKGLRISQAGPDLIKKFGFMGANTARRFDPQIAAIYYDQMVKKGKHHTQAVCACATHLLDRILVILREDRPYELRDIDGTPITPEQAKAIIAERYQVPEEVRQRNSKRARRERTDQQLERRQPKQKGSRPRR